METLLKTAEKMLRQSFLKSNTSVSLPLKVAHYCLQDITNLINKVSFFLRIATPQDKHYTI